MGVCSELLGAINETLAFGLQLRGLDGEVITPALENGVLQDISTAMNSFAFDAETGELLTICRIPEGDFQIGSVEVKDGSTNARLSVLADGLQNAMFVQSNSLLGTLTFENVMDDIYELIGTQNNTLTSIKGQTDKFTFSSTRLLTNSKVQDSDGSFIDPATSEDISALEDSLSDKLDTLIENAEILTTPANDIIYQTTISVNADEDPNVYYTLNNITVPDVVRDRYLLSFLNESEETDVVIQLYLKEDFAVLDTTPTTKTKFCKHGDNFTVNKTPDVGSPDGEDSEGQITKMVEGAFLAKGLGLSAKLVTGTGGSGAFNLRITIREI
jgi:hypothetical protein